MSSIVVAGDTSGSITISAPAVSGSNTLSLPAVTDTLAGIAATQTLTNKTLVAPALGTPASGVLTNCTGVVAGALPAGSVLQVVSATKTDTQSTTSGSFIDLTGLSVSITPRSASSKILISASVGRGTAGNQITFFQFVRDSTAIGIGDTAGSRVRSTMAAYFGSSDAVSHIGTFTMNYLDSPSTTSATTYKVQFRSQDGSQTSYINRNSSDGDGVTVPRTISTITVMEIQG